MSAGASKPEYTDPSVKYGPRVYEKGRKSISKSASNLHVYNDEDKVTRGRKAPVHKRGPGTTRIRNQMKVSSPSNSARNSDTAQCMEKNTLYEDKGSKSDEESSRSKTRKDNFSPTYRNNHSEDEDGGGSWRCDSGRGTAVTRSDTPSSLFGFTRSVSTLSLNDPSLLNKLMNG